MKLKKMIFTLENVPMNYRNSNINNPSEGEEVIVWMVEFSCGVYWRIKGYETALNGDPQAFHGRCFKKPSSKHVSKSLISEIRNNPEWVENVPQTIGMKKEFVLDADF